MPEMTPVPAIHRFLERVVITAECWNWIGLTDRHGYGVIDDGGRRFLAHRWSYENLGLPIGEGLHLHHRCENIRCVNPAHLEPISPSAHALRGENFAARNSRKTHCPQGHPYDEANTLVLKGKWRACRACRQARNKKAAPAVTETASA